MICRVSLANAPTSRRVARGVARRRNPWHATCEAVQCQNAGTVTKFPHLMEKVRQRETITHPAQQPAHPPSHTAPTLQNVSELSVAERRNRKGEREGRGEGGRKREKGREREREGGMERGRERERERDNDLNSQEGG